MRNAYCVYAIVRHDTPLPPAGNTSGTARLVMVSWGELAAVTAQTGNDGAAFTAEAILRHEEIVEAVRQQGPALPVRFGTVFRDTALVASAIADRHDLLAADLDRIGDKVELSLTALWAVPPAEAEDEVSGGSSAGARYLHARAATLRREEALKERARTVDRTLDEVLGGHALERRASLLPTPRIAVRAAYLLDPAGVGAFRAVFDAVSRMQRQVHLLLTGPWPPYSFVRRTATSHESAPDGRLAELAQILTDTMRSPH